MKKPEVKNEYRETLTDLYYLLSDIRKIEERLMNIKKEVGYMVQSLLEEDLKGGEKK